jgi:hypothetical protein
LLQVHAAATCDLSFDPRLAGWRILQLTSHQEGLGIIQSSLGSPFEELGPPHVKEWTGLTTLGANWLRRCMFHIRI